MAAVVAITTVAGLTTASPASAAPSPFTLTMVPGGGQLTLAGAEPFVVETPTSFTGTIDDATGVLGNLTFSTPAIEFQQESSGLLVDVTAKLTLLSATGNADGLGNVSIDAAIRLDVNLDVADGAIVTDCVSSPVNIALVSTTPYDSGTQRVTLADPSFTIPPVANDGTCNPAVIGPVNDALAGPGNAFSVTLEGALALPPPPGDPSETTLASSAESTPLGFPVTFTATVEPDDATGNVVFFDGPSQIGQAPLNENAQAVFTTSALSVGTHQITARYTGNVDYEGSTSNVVTHTVTAVPAVTADIPELVVAGGAPAEFTATITNPSSGATLPNLRVDMVFGALSGLGATNLVVEWNNGGTWEVLPTTGSATTRTARFPSMTGFSLGAGQTRGVDLRITAAAAAGQGRLPVSFTLANVDNGTGAILTNYGAVTGTTWVVGAERRPTTAAVTAVVASAQNAPTPRVGDSIRVSGTITRGGTPTPVPSMTGQVQILVDGVVVAAITAPSTGSVSTIIPAGPDSPLNDLAPGPHQAQVRYLGDSVYRASLSLPFPFTLLPWTGVRYSCSLDLVAQTNLFAARVEVQAVTPASVLSGTEVPLQRLDITIYTEGSPSFLESFSNFGISDQVLTFTEGVTGTFGDLGTSTPVPAGIEGLHRLVAPTGTLLVDGEPGEVVDIGLEGFSFARPAPGGLKFTAACTANEEPEPFASVTVAGTTVSTTATNPVEEGTSVPLTANVFPSTAQGLVEFFRGSESIGLAPVSGGVAQLNADDLAQGSHEITARYLGDLVNPPSVSAPVAVSVRDVVLCKDQTGTESGSVVRATYLSLLGRCAEPSGFAFWRGRLDGGLSAEVFAGQIANTLEAHGRSVDDGYRLVLGRNADASGRAFWAQRLSSGQRYDLLLGDLAASNEFWTAAGSTNSGFVTRLYDRLLHRTPDASGLAYWVGRLNAGVSRASVAAAFVRLPEPSGQIVADAYEAILDRAPTGTEKAPAVARFQADGHRWKVYAGLIGTTEFHDRAQGHPNR